MSLLVVIGAVFVAYGQVTGTLTLHAYANRVQIPVLVLSEKREPMPPIDPQKFAVSIDDGPLFRTPHVRREGDDPVTLTILLDASAGRGELLAQMPAAMEALGPFRAYDRVDVFALSRCRFTRVLVSRPTSPTLLRHSAIEAAQLPVSAQNKQEAADCGRPERVWGALGYLIDRMADLPGRRVVLLIGNGSDTAGKLSEPDLERLAFKDAVTVFALGELGGMAGTGERTRGLFRKHNEPGLLTSLCERTGGMVMASPPDGFARVLQRFVPLLRGRYIVDFPRPPGLGSGGHTIRVEIADTQAFVRPAGNSAPVADPKALADPDTVPSDPTLAPSIGTGH